jgi:DNA primase
VRYFTSRRADTEFTPAELERGRKTYHPASVSHRGVLFGESALVETRLPLFVVEGPMDMLAFGGHAVCLLGKRLSDSTAQRIAALGRSVCVALDADEPGESAVADVARQLRRAGVARVLASRGVEGDPADHARAGARRVCARYLAAAAEFGEEACLRDALHRS